MENPEQAAELLDWLQKAGAGVAIDDFGTGYSALSYLSRFSFDTIKIDRSFLHDVRANADAAMVVRCIVSLAHGLGRAIIAEGVETEEDAAFLKSIGCEFGQGFLLSEPLNDRQAIEVLQGIRRHEQRGAGGGFLGRVIGNVLGRREEEPDEVVLSEPVKAPMPPVRPAEAPRGGNGAPTSGQPRPHVNGPPTFRAAPAQPSHAPPGAPTTMVSGRPLLPPGAPTPPTTGRPAPATFERRGAVAGVPHPPAAAPPMPRPGLAELERRPHVANTGAREPLVPLPGEAIPALDPALEQRIRSIFRDTALSGEPAPGDKEKT
jgi:hypothetical protein